MFRGRYRLGDLFPLSVWCRNAAGTPTLPDAAPRVRITDADGDFVLAQKIPIIDPDDITGLFRYRLSLDSRFSTGTYHVSYQYEIGGTAYGKTEDLEIVAGGHTDGAGISMYYMRQSPKDFVLLQTDGGLLRKLRNPRL
jgi:hypothetical protein